VKGAGVPSSGRRLGNTVPKILVADDNTNIQKMVTLAFQDRGVEVITVGNGEAAVRRLPDLRPDLVLADVFMPVRNGYEVCEFVKKDERFSHIPVILLVGAFDPLDEKEARRVGADGVLKKPFVPPDPLIAMVMSALEKNPKVAAEMAKARELAAAPPPPPMPELEIPAKAEPKPLPDYPEPTAEEAAAIYGFGKGVRALDDEPEIRASQPSPIKAKKDKEEDEEFDGSSTASDWRRSAADFEVPTELGGSLAFTPDEDFSPSFPSERDVPPRHIRVEDSALEIQPVVAESSSASSPAPSQFAAVNETAAASATHSLETQVEIIPEPEPLPEPEQEYAPSRASRELQPGGIMAADAEPKQESGFLTKAAHWMDMMAPAPAENSNGGSGGGWMSNLLGLHKEKEPEVTPEAHKPAIEAPVEAKSQSLAEPQAETAAPMETAYSEVHTPQQSERVEPQATATVEQSERVAPPSSELWFNPPAPPVEAVVETSAAQEVISDSSPIAPAISAPQGDEFDREPDNFEPSLRDPMLDESPAVHVQAEPLLVDDDVSGPSEYGKRAEKMSPLHSFFSPASGDPVVEESGTAEAAAPSEFPVIEEAHIEAAADQFDERIPTVPPPNREALAAIPFLTPPIPTPQEIHSEESSAQQSSAASDDRRVDDLVRKVLEKLQPQLQEMLSQGVLKPLVENMLQNEISKKEK
jgi:CheY-like chemotaxis protein